MNIYILTRWLFFFRLTSSLSAQVTNQIAPPLNSMTLPEQSANVTVKQDHDNSDRPGYDTLRDNIRLILQSRYNVLNHLPILKVETRDGQHYTGSKKGIAFWDGYSTLNFTTDNAGIPENNITALAVDEQNNLWIGTASHGIVKGFGNPFKPFKTKIIQTHDLDIYSIVSEGSGAMWVTYSDGGFEYFQVGASKAYFPSPKTE